MRLQPPKNIKYFVGKKATKKRTISYIGSHIILGKDIEMTLDEYINSNEDLDSGDIPAMLTLFPYEIWHFSKFYLDSKLVNRKTL